MKKVNGFYLDIVNAVPSLTDEQLIRHLDYSIKIAQDLKNRKEKRIEINAGKGGGKVSRLENILFWMEYEPYLIKRYIREMVEELNFRGNEKGDEYTAKYFELLRNEEVIEAKVERPEWLVHDFIHTHSKYIVEKIK